MTFNEVVLWLFSAVGAVTAVVQLWKWVHGRRAERGLARLLESYVDRDEAEATRAELHRLELTLRELRVRAPEIARRMHLEQRRRDLLFVVLINAGSLWLTVTSLDGWRYVDPAVVPLNAVAGGFAILSACCLRLAGVGPLPQWQHLPVRLTRSRALNNR